MRIETAEQHARRTGHRVTLRLNEPASCDYCNWLSPEHFLVEAVRVEPKWSDLFGIDPDFTGGACSVCYVRWGRGDDDLHDECRALLMPPTTEERRP